MAPKGYGKRGTDGRSFISKARLVGEIVEWKGSWGWIKPLDVVNHPSIWASNGLIYVHRSDAKGYVKMEVGSRLEFQAYVDERGLGAADCSEVKVSAVAAAAAKVASDDAVLPEGWEKHWSVENNEHFYWNRLTKETSWLPPGMGLGGEKKATVAPPLPKGWTKHYDEENRQWYYWNKATKKASWERPEEPAEEPEDVAPPAKKAKVGDDDADTAPVLGQKRVRGQVAEWHGFFGWIAPLQELSTELRPLLEKGEGKIYLNWRDVQPGLDIKADMEVDFMLFEDDNGLAASDVRAPGAKKTGASKQAKSVSQLTSKWAEEDEADAGEAAEAAAAAAEEGDEANEGPLLPGWEQQWSPEHACHYYWHAATQVAAWERPCLPADLGDEEDAGGEKIWAGEGSEEISSYAQTPMTPWAAQQAAKKTALSSAR